MTKHSGRLDDRVWILWIVIMGFLPGLSAQTFEHLQYPVTRDGNIFENPFMGGLNAPQFSKIDLNNDGLEDLFVFDRIGNVPITYINQGTPNEPDYEFDPRYAHHFPDMRNWALLKDYDNDGAPDLFTNFTSPFLGILVYKGSFNGNNELVFDLLNLDCLGQPALCYTTSGGFQAQIYVPPTDVPAFEDVDGDGDMDILSFSSGGGYVEYYQNLAIDQSLGLEELKFKKADFCWGKFYEASFGEEITLSSSPDECATGFTDDDPVEFRHPGSTLCVFDNDNDGDLEILLGDVISPKIIFLENGGTPEQAFMTDQDAFFPSYDVSVEIFDFPATYYFDYDNDGLKDLIASPNNLNGTEDYEVAWFYKNTQSNEFPLFELQQKDALAEGSLDFGTGANPTFFDYNADGLKDIVIGTYGFFVAGGTTDPRLILLENTGTPEAPSFDLVDDDWLGMSQYGPFTWFFAPAFGDMDNDGDLDLVIGEQSGSLIYSENEAGAGNPSSFGPFQFEWKDIDVGLNARPTIADLNRDGLKDLVVGERNGNLNYFQNIGTTTDPQFNPDPEVAPNLKELGDVDTDLPGDISAGNSAPFIVDFGDEFILFCGTEVGPIQAYTDVEGNLDGVFNLEVANYGNSREGERTSPALGDIDGDGLFEMVVGNNRGGISIFKTILNSEGALGVSEPQQLSFSIRPNPAKDQLLLDLNDLNTRDVFVRLISATGRELARYEGFDPSQLLDISGLAPGIYFCEVVAGQTRGVEKLVVVK
jgi:hypothetical protein